MKVCILKEYMQRIGMTGKELSRKSGLSEAAISQILNNGRSGNLKSWIAITGALNCKLDDLFIEEVEDGEIR